MSYLVLARKWRPRSFEELVGQDHVRRALANALDSGRIHHAFLFTGTRGVGKTTIARIFAKSLNCERGVSSKPCGECGACRDIDAGRFVDLLEVDAASRTKVDDTRELLDNVQYAPARGRCKVYLIDEVHMLSTHSFNALLKTLEEPPPHVKFLLATTDPQKLPVTVLSRCLQFHLRRLPLPLIQERLASIAQAEKVEFEPAALRAIARSAEGSMRDALSLLDQVLAFGGGRALESEVRSAARHARPPSRRGHADRARGGRRRVAHGLRRRARRARARLRPGARRAGGGDPAHGAAAGAAGPDAARTRSRTSRSRGSPPRFSPEDLQLLYQIAIMARRDLDFAPDARGGFEMALLRMLAFRPETAGRSLGLVRAMRRPRSRPATACGAAGRVRGAAAARRGRVAAPSARAEPGSGEWPATVAALGLQGPASQLAAHCVLVERAGDVVKLRLDAAGEHYRRPQLEQKLAEALSNHFGTSRAPVDRGERGRGADACPPAGPRGGRSPARGRSRRSRRMPTCAPCARSSARRCSRDRSSP